MEQGSTGLGGGASHARERKGATSPIYSVELELFEGPLDLLLHLVRKHELEILDIPIAFVAEKYLEYLDVMRQLDLEIAGDYLVMAATLAYLKSRELLPPEPRRGGEAGESEDEDGEDPREALIRRLVEYERFKQAAAELDSLPMSGRDVFARGADLVMPPVDPGLQPVSLFNLAEAYYRVLTRAKVKSTHDVTIEAVTVAQRIKQLALMLDERPSLDFEELFLDRTWNSERELRTMLVVTLMSILEMVKLGVAGVQQPLDSTTIRIYRRASAEQTQQALADYDEDVSFGNREPAASGDEATTGAPTVAAARAREAELDAVEEATLLAEALAGVQEPEEPVLGYDEESDDVAANDAASVDEEDVDDRVRPRGRGRASSARGAGVPDRDASGRGEPDVEAEDETGSASADEVELSGAVLSDVEASESSQPDVEAKDETGSMLADEVELSGAVVSESSQAGVEAEDETGSVLADEVELSEAVLSDREGSGGGQPDVEAEDELGPASVDEVEFSEAVLSDREGSGGGQPDVEAEDELGPASVDQIELSEMVLSDREDSGGIQPGVAAKGETGSILVDEVEFSGAVVSEREDSGSGQPGVEAEDETGSMLADEVEFLGAGVSDMEDSERAQLRLAPDSVDEIELSGHQEPVFSDSDEVVAGGLFLNTGEGLGERELGEDEDDGEEEDPL